LIDYEKMFCPLPAPGADIFSLRSIGPEGCLVIVRPDQYVAEILPLTDHAGLGAYFARFMPPA
jgi:phenol 2-monooxygenase